jgi:hypothetical protein
MFVYVNTYVCAYPVRLRLAQKGGGVDVHRLLLYKCAHIINMHVCARVCIPSQAVLGTERRRGGCVQAAAPRMCTHCACACEYVCVNVCMRVLTQSGCAWHREEEGWMYTGCCSTNEHTLRICMCVHACVYPVRLCLAQRGGEVDVCRLLLHECAHLMNMHVCARVCVSSQAVLGTERRRGGCTQAAAPRMCTHCACACEYVCVNVCMRVLTQSGCAWHREEEGWMYTGCCSTTVL